MPSFVSGEVSGCYSKIRQETADPLTKFATFQCNVTSLSDLHHVTYHFRSQKLRRVGCE